ncbi:MAG: OmpA family protein [Bacteroidales bacterium]|nr:OmpA family protein [Bacteroidales bacterium]HPB05526.1 phosphate ABC transporter substrate-binding/OmpA family protein [Prolixibacteraceae bacterium]
MTTDYQNKTEKSIPGFPKKWTFGFQLFVLILIIGAVGAGVYFGYPYLNKSSNGNRADLRAGFNNFVGFAPGIHMNGGVAPNKDSRMYTEFGLTFEAIRMDDMQKLNDALKNGDLDFIFTTTDISPIGMDRSSDLAKMSVVQFLKIDDSRGADVFIVDKSINTVADLKGKKIACALGWPSNTLLHATLEAGGLTEQDVKILPMSDPFAAKTAFTTGNADATVVWSPDDEECLKSRDAKVLTSTDLLPNIIMDGFIARKDVLEKKKDLFVKLSRAWLVANSEMRDPGKMAKAAQTYKIAFDVPDDVSIILDGMKKIHFANYGDNINFFGLSTDYTGLTGQQLYTKMARVYKNGYGNKLNNIVPWAEASYPGIIQEINDLQGDAHKAEGQIVFETPTAADEKAPAVAIKPIIINFATASWALTPEMKDKIENQLGQLSVEFAGMKVRIEGNTDNVGSAEMNRDLSRKRAQSVADYLVKTYNFDPNRFVIVGNGPDKPVASNNSEEGKAANRRTEFQLLGK